MKKIKLNLLGAILLLTVFMVSCSTDNDDNEELPEVEIPSLAETTVWSGSVITFQKEVGADPALAENQDRITNNVWITRENSGGQIFNIAVESTVDKDLSPEGTLWAIGTTANLQNLTFDRFRTILEKPKDNVGTDLVMLLVEDNIAIDIKFTSWSTQQLGGFVYERSTEE